MSNKRKSLSLMTSLQRETEIQKRTQKLAQLAKLNEEKKAREASDNVKQNAYELETEKRIMDLTKEANKLRHGLNKWIQNGRPLITPTNYQ